MKCQSCRKDKPEIKTSYDLCKECGQRLIGNFESLLEQMIKDRERANEYDYFNYRAARLVATAYS